MPSKFYLANAIPYTNARPHIGHFLEFVLSDAIARYHRLRGDTVYFGLGSDENGQKMWQTARDAGREPLDLASENAKHFEDLRDVIGISYDGFVRTTSEAHRRASQAMWGRLDKAGDLYKKKYKGLYCVGCESFKTEKDLVNGFCPNHPGKPLKVVEEENYFFSLSKYGDRLRDLLASGQLRIIPEFRKNELLNFINDGLEDVSFSRPKSSLPWGIEVPGDSDHVMYVWCDALTNYLTHTGFPDPNFEKLHPVDLHMIGKDITRFHALIYQAMLMSAALETSKAIYVHEFVTMDGAKMSKSVGNVVDPYEIMDQYGSEALRFYLLSESVQGNDLDFTWERFAAIYDSKLRNGLGNLANRIISLVQKLCDGTLPDGTTYDTGMTKIVEDAWQRFHVAMTEKRDVSESIGYAMTLIGAANIFLTGQAPWATFKTDPHLATSDLHTAAMLLINAARLLLPAIPTTASAILGAFGIEAKAEAYLATEKVTVQPLPILFPPVEPKA